MLTPSSPPLLLRLLTKIVGLALAWLFANCVLYVVEFVEEGESRNVQLKAPATCVLRPMFVD